MSKRDKPTPLQDGFDAALGKGRYRSAASLGFTPVNPWPAGSKEAAEWEEGWLLTGRGLPK